MYMIKLINIKTLKMNKNVLDYAHLLNINFLEHINLYLCLKFCRFKSTLTIIFIYNNTAFINDLYWVGSYQEQLTFKYQCDFFKFNLTYILYE